MEENIKNILLNNYSKYYKIIFTYLKNRDDSLDCLSSGAEKVILNQDKIKNSNYIDSYIVRIMINEALTFLRKQKRDLEFFDFNENFEENVITYNKVKNIDLENALLSLNETERNIVLMKYFENLKISEISEILLLNENTVKTKIHRILKKLKTYMEG